MVLGPLKLVILLTRIQGLFVVCIVVCGVVVKSVILLTTIQGLFVVCIVVCGVVVKSVILLTRFVCCMHCGVWRCS